MAEADLDALSQRYFPPASPPAPELEDLSRRYFPRTGPTPPVSTPARARAAAAPAPAGTPGVQPNRWVLTIQPAGAPADQIEVPGTWQDAVGVVTQLKGQYRPGTQFDIGPVPSAPSARLAPPDPQADTPDTRPGEDLPLEESLNPVDMAIMGGGISAGATLGALKGPVSRIMGAGAGGFLANRVNRAIGYTPGGAFGPVDAGDVVSAVAPMVVETGTMGVTKWKNARQGQTAEPADRALIDLAQKHDIDQGLTYGDVVGPTRNPGVARQQIHLERTTRGAQTRQAGQAETKAAAEGFREHYARQVRGDFEGLPEVQAAARAGDREARSTLDLAHRASDHDPGAVVQASARVKLMRDKLQADALYAERDRLAQQLGHRLETPETLRAAYTALDQVQGSVLNLDPRGTTKKQVEAILTRLEPTRTPHAQFPGTLPDVETPARVSFHDLVRLRHELDIAINQPSATPFEQQLLGEIRAGIQTDMRTAALASRKPQLIAAQEQADAFYPGVVRQREFVKSVEDLPPDQVVPTLIRRGQGDRAQGAFDALEPKGQAAVRVDILNRALYDGNAPAIHPGTGHFSPARFAKNLEDLRAATGVFFPSTGEGAWELQGFTNLMRHLERNGAYIENPPTGQRLLDYFHAGTAGEVVTGGLAGYAAGGVKGAVAGAGTPLSLAAFNGLKNWALMTPRGRDFMLAASDLSPGTRAFQSLLTGAVKDVPELQPVVNQVLGLQPAGEERR
jgi:hypothetical protein